MGMRCDIGHAGMGVLDMLCGELLPQTAKAALVDPFVEFGLVREKPRHLTAQFAPGLIDLGLGPLDKISVPTRSARRCKARHSLSLASMPELATEALPMKPTEPRFAAPLCAVGGPFHLGDIDFAHIPNRRQGASSTVPVGACDQFHQSSWRHLPGDAPAVLEPAAGHL